MSSPRLPRVAGRARPAPGIAALLGVIALLLLPAGVGSAVLTLAGTGSPGSMGSPGPLAGGRSYDGAGACASTLVATVPSGGARATVAVTEPALCAGRTRLTFLPGLNFTNALSVTTGHILEAGLEIASFSDPGTMVRALRLVLEQSTGTHGLLTTTAAVVRNDLIATAASSNGTVAATVPYGLGVTMVLSAPARASTASVGLALVLTLDDGGTVRAVVEESIALSISY